MLYDEEYDEIYNVLLKSICPHNIHILERSSYLVEFKLKAQYVTQGERFTHVGLDEGQEEFILVRSTLVHLQDYVQNTIRV